VREARRSVLLVALVAAGAAVLSSGSVNRLPGVPTVPDGSVASVRSDAALPDPMPVLARTASLHRPAAAATGRSVALSCPTRRAPGCKLSWIRHDVGWRIHPVYGYHSCHTGIDLRGSYGDRIRAAAAGTVIRVGTDRAYGRYTLIQVNPVIRTFYAHQSRVLVRVGQQVSARQVIGKVGSTGFATGPHLHFEVHVHRHPYDPDGWFGAAHQRPVSCYPGVKY
jgi:murein DD-endopeptidase MepM/ murein hydrolase activator NlpD